MDDLPLAPNLGGTNVTDGVDRIELVDIVECLRTIAGPGDPSGAFVRAVIEWVGEGIGERLSPNCGSNRTACIDLRAGDIDVLGTALSKT